MQNVSGPDLLAGRVAIVTGGGHGIGKAYCRGLAANGAAVLVADIDGEAAAAVAKELQEGGCSAAFSEVDVSDPESVQDMTRVAKDELGSVDILVNNAAVFSRIPVSRVGFEDIPFDEWDRVMEVNVKGVWLASRAAVPYMREAGYGKIINISSGTALKGSASRIHYVTSKAAVLGFTRSLAREIGQFDICVNAVAPGSTLSEDNPSEATLNRRGNAASLRPLSRVETPEDLVGAVVFLSGPGSDFITGQTLVVDGGSFMH